MLHTVAATDTTCYIQSLPRILHATYRRRHGSLNSVSQGLLHKVFFPPQITHLATVIQRRAVAPLGLSSWRLQAKR